MENIYLPKEEFQTFNSMSFTELMLEFSNWWRAKDVTTKEYKMFEKLDSSSIFAVPRTLQYIIAGDIEVLQEKEIKYRLYHEQDTSAGQGFFKYHYFTKNAGLDETDCFENIDVLTKEEADELIDDMGEWLGEWLYEVED